MGDDLHIDGLGLQLPTAQLFAYFQSCVHSPLQVPLQASAEVPEHGGASGEHDILVERTPDVDGTVLDDFIHHL